MDILGTKRIINLPAESTPASGDAFVVDNESTGTKKLPVENFLDPTFKKPGTAAESAAVGIALAGKASAIVAEGEYSTTHIITDGVSSDITIKGNSFTRFTAKIANKANECPALFSTTAKGITYTASGHFHNFSGITTAAFNNMALINSSTIAPDALLGKRIKLFVKSNRPVDFSERTDGKTSTFQILQNNSAILTITPEPTDIFNVEGTFDFSDISGTKIGLTLPNFPEGIDMTGIIVWYGMYIDESFASTDTQQTITDGDTIKVPVPSGYNIIDTFMHESAIQEVVDTKEYVDNHIPSDVLTAEDLIYVTPEMFGAVGDNAADDSTALQNCIDYAVAKGLPVRAYGTYKILTGLSIAPSSGTYTYTDVFINEIYYMGSGDAVTINGQANKFICNYLNAYYATNATSALKISGGSQGAKYNEIHVTRVYGYNNAVDIDAENSSVIYNKLYINRIISRQGNCFYLHGTVINENDIYCKSASCVNGYVVHAEKGGTNYIHGLSIENECKNGVYGSVILVDCRTGECMDQKESDLAKGTIYTIPAGMSGYIPKAINTLVDIEAFDLTQADTYEDKLQALAQLYESGTAKIRCFDLTFGAISPNYIIGNCNRYIADDANGYSDFRCLLTYGKLFAYYNHKGFIPDNAVTATIDEADFYTHKRAFPTEMILGTNSTIHLDDSYCCIGINNFTIKQIGSYKATIYDKNNNLIFDGTNHDAGTYRFTCKMMRLQSLDVELSNGTVITYGANTVSFLYTGSNEVWTVEKLNIIA